MGGGDAFKKLGAKNYGVMHGLTLNNGCFAILLYLITSADFLVLGSRTLILLKS
tara:strand:- start:6755 stop:6916 length:162 start_codon:yes stop_codon:yes gene_type:complete